MYKVEARMLIRRTKALLLVLALYLLLTSSSALASSPVLKQGDLLVYRYIAYGSIFDMEVDCEFVIRITVEDVEGYRITYYASWGIVRIDKGFNMCIRIPESDRYTINTSYRTPSSGEFIVDPAYSGVYDIVYKGFAGRAEYYRGILISLNTSFYNLTTRIDLVNSSILELKPFIKPNYTYTIPIRTPTTTPSIDTESASISVSRSESHYTTTLCITTAVISVTVISVIFLAKKKSRGYHRTKTPKNRAITSNSSNTRFCSPINH